MKNHSSFQSNLYGIKKYHKILVLCLLLLTTLFLFKCKKTEQVAADAAPEGSTTKLKVLTLIDKHITWNANVDTNTHRINRALNDVTVGKVILDYSANPWEVDTIHMRKPNHQLVIPGSGSNSGKLEACSTCMVLPNSILVKIEANGCTINGYNNGVDTTSGRAILAMRKSTYTTVGGYTPSEGRHGVSTSGMSDATIQGVNIVNAGGDGIYVGSGGHHIVIKDVITDGANRNGISIIGARNLTLTNSRFLNSTGDASTGTTNGPWAGLDIEPNTSAVAILDSITITGCTFANNKGNNVQLGFKNDIDATNPVHISFYNCKMLNGLLHGIRLSTLKTTGPASGMIYFQDCQVTNPKNCGVDVSAWSATQVYIAFNNLTIYNAAAATSSAPIAFEGTDYRAGHVSFQNSEVDDFNSAHSWIMLGSSTNNGFQDIDTIAGAHPALKMTRHYTSSNPLTHWTYATGYPNINVTF